MLKPLFVLICGLMLQAQQMPASREWGQPIRPFQIAGSVYYVGMAQVTSLLIATPKGHILIDGAFPESASGILENVRALGFKPEEIRIILSTHAHADHAGGLAEIKAKTGARLYAGAADVPLLARGGKQDFAFGDSLAFPPVTADVAVKDGDEVTLGNITVRAIATPGHTKGCTTWAFTIQDHGKPLRVIMLGGNTAPNYQLVNNAKYPGIATDFENSFRKLKALTCDIPIEGHGFFFALDEKRTGKRSFIDPDGYQNSLARFEENFRKQLEQQRAEIAASSKPEKP